MELGIIPCGTGNDSSRTLYPVTDPYKLLSVLPISSSSDFDIGKANDRYFLNIASVGFDADVVMQSRRYKSLMSGSMAYLIGALSALLKQKNTDSESQSMISQALKRISYCVYLLTDPIMEVALKLLLMLI